MASKKLFQTIFDPRSSIVKSVFVCHLSAVEKPPLNVHADATRRARGLKFSLSLYLHPYFVYVVSEGSGETVQMRRLF